jgi:hypothetical protein
MHLPDLGAGRHGHRIASATAVPLPRRAPLRWQPVSGHRPGTATAKTSTRVPHRSKTPSPAPFTAPLACRRQFSIADLHRHHKLIRGECPSSAALKSMTHLIDQFPRPLPQPACRIGRSLPSSSAMGRLPCLTRWAASPVLASPLVGPD